MNDLSCLQDEVFAAKTSLRQCEFEQALQHLDNALKIIAKKEFS